MENWTYPICELNMSAPGKVFDMPHTLPFTNSIDSSISSTIAAWIDSASTAIKRKQIRIEIDVDPLAGAAACERQLRTSLESALVMALERSPTHSELSITVLQTDRGQEIEIADAGSDLSDQERECQQLAFSTSCNVSRRPTFEALQSQDQVGCHVDLYCIRCPQGGVAWTLVQRFRAASFRVA